MGIGGALAGITSDIVVGFGSFMLLNGIGAARIITLIGIATVERTRTFAPEGA